jgi:Uma2 family endonuclease
MVANIKPITSKEFAQFVAQTENVDRLFELINGEIIEKVTTQLHALIANLFDALLYLMHKRLNNEPISCENRQ